ncbi:MAG: hypothetical protein ACO1N5_18045 [Noviherbaspirillum sp.]
MGISEDDKFFISTMDVADKRWAGKAAQGAGRRQVRPLPGQTSEAGKQAAKK